MLLSYIGPTSNAMMNQFDRWYIEVAPLFDCEATANVPDLHPDDVGVQLQEPKHPFLHELCSEKESVSVYDATVRVSCCIRVFKAYKSTLVRKLIGAYYDAMR